MQTVLLLQAEQLELQAVVDVQPLNTGVKLVPVQVATAAVPAYPVAQVTPVYANLHPAVKAPVALAVLYPATELGTTQVREHPPRVYSPPLVVHAVAAAVPT